MSTFDQDLTHLNFEYLMLARECARNNPLEAVYRFGINRQQVDAVAGFSLEKIREIAACSRAAITLIPLNTPCNISLTTHAALLTATLDTKEAK